MTSVPPKGRLVATTKAIAQSVTARVNSLVPSLPSAESPVTVFQSGTDGVGAQLSAPTSVFPAGAGYYGVWTAPDLADGQNYTVQVECFGGGGGGGGGSSTSGGGGGGGGEYCAESYYPVVPGQGYVWVAGVPGSAGSANSDSNQGATAGGTGGNTQFDIAGTGVAGGVLAHGGLGGDVGNTGNGGAGGSGGSSTTEYAGGGGGTNLPGSSGSGSGAGGQGGTDSPLNLASAGLLAGSVVAWYVFSDSSSSGKLNDSSGQGAAATPNNISSPGLVYQAGASPAQVPAYASSGGSPGMPNPTTAGTVTQFSLQSLSRPSAWILTPGIDCSGSAFTFSGWIAPDPSGTWGNTASGSRAQLAGNTTGFEDGSHAAGYAVYLQNSGTPANPSWALYFYTASGSTSAVISAPVAASGVYYVVCTFSSGAMTLYLNGASAATGTAGFTSMPDARYSTTIGTNCPISADWFFGYVSNFWFAKGVLSSAGVTQAYAGSGGSSTGGGAGGGASGGPAAGGGAGAAGSGSAGGTGGTPAVQPANDVGINTPASPGIAGSASGSGNSGFTGSAGAGGGGAGLASSPPTIITIDVPFTTAAAYCGTDATGGSAGSVYNPVIQGTSGRLFTGGQASDSASGSKNSLLILPPGLAKIVGGTSSVLRVTLTVTSAVSAQSAQNALMQLGWSADTFLPATFTGASQTGSAGTVEIPAGAYTVTADLTESQLGTYIASGGATALVLGPGAAPTFAAYSAATSPDFYTAVYGPGAVDGAGNNLAPFLTITYAQAGTGTVQQGSPGGSGGIQLTYVSQSQTLVGNFSATSGTAVNGEAYDAGLNATGGQTTGTTVVLGTTSPSYGARRAGRRMGASPTTTQGAVLGYSDSVVTTTQTTPGTYTFTVPAGVTSLSAQCWGGGAGGTGGNFGQGQGGGGGGAYAAEPAYAVTPGDVLTYFVGAGGAGDTIGTNSAPDGQASGFDTTNVAGGSVTAYGGQHYNGSFNYGPGGGLSGNTVNFIGGNGGPLVSGQNQGSGGGGSAGATGRGTGGSTGGGGGHPGSGGGAAGGNGGSTTGSGLAGTAPGGGGGGAGDQGSGAQHGGNGARGQVTFSYVSASTLVTSVATAAGTDAGGNAYPEGHMTPSVTLLSSASAAVAMADTSGQQVVVDGTDGQTYSTQRKSIVSGGVGFTTTYTTIFSSTVGIRDYRLHGKVFFNVSGTVTLNAQVNGPGTPTGSVGFTCTRSTSTFVGFVMTAFNTSTPISAAGAFTGTVNGFILEIDGVIAVPSSGTLAVQFAATGGGAVTVVSGSFLDVMPV